MILKAKLKKIRAKLLIIKFYNTFIGKDVLAQDSAFLAEKEKEIETKLIKTYHTLYTQENPHYCLKLIEMFSFHSVYMIYKLYPTKTIFQRINKLFFLSHK